MEDEPKKRRVHRRTEQPVELLYDPQAMVRADTIARFIGYSERQVWRMAAKGLLGPDPVKLKEMRGTRWPAPQVLQALARLGLVRRPSSSE